VRAGLLAAGTAVLVTVAGCGGGSHATVTSTVTATSVVTVTRAAPVSSAGRDESTADVVARVLPGVVNVRTVGFDGGRGEASGVVIDKAGVILTNYHVVQGARTLTVFFDDGRHRKPARAQVIGTAADRDLAIIRVPQRDLAPVPLGRSSTLRLGDAVLAIGFPLNLGGGPTVTGGIVSGLDRSVHAHDGPDLTGLLQTDAAINPGNSGGALVDSTGKLVGINTIGATGAQDVGFAISIDEARPVIDEIRRKPAGATAWIGATFAPITSASSAVQIGLPPATRGAAVVALFSGSPASRAGLHEGDAVVAVDGRPVRSSTELSKALAASKPGETLTLDVVDSSGPRRTNVTVGTRPATLGGG
jgi:S1-C subfamily serine protease